MNIEAYPGWKCSICYCLVAKYLSVTCRESQKVNFVFFFFFTHLRLLYDCGWHIDSRFVRFVIFNPLIKGILFDPFWSFFLLMKPTLGEQLRRKVYLVPWVNNEANLMWRGGRPWVCLLPLIELCFLLMNKTIMG